jgi:DNA-binding PadR family transcriptional regulator
MQKDSSRSRQEDLQKYLPITPAAFHVLISLAEGDKHGYAILKEVSRRTEGRVRFSASTLYGIVKRLLADGFVVELDERPDPALDDERRRYYRLTEFGRKVAIAESERMDELVSMAASFNLKRLKPSKARS